MNKFNSIVIKGIIVFTLLITLIFSVNICQAVISNGGHYEDKVTVGLTNEQKNSIKNFTNKLIAGRSPNSKGEIILKNHSYSNYDRSTAYDYNYANYTKNKQLTFDCSSFVSTVYHVALGKKMTVNGNPYTTVNFSSRSYYNINNIDISKIDEPDEIRFKIVTTRKKDRISYKSLQRGDIILCLQDNTPKHVILYIGNGKYMHTYGSLGYLVVDNDKTNPSNCNWYLKPGAHYSKLMVLRGVQLLKTWIPSAEQGNNV